MEYQIHPIAEIFPLMRGAAFDELVSDIKDRGLREPIVLHEGQVLDGRNRLRACQSLGIDPTIKIFDGSDPLAYVISVNLRRRHLKDGQRALVAARLANMRQGRRMDLGKGAAGEISRSMAAGLLNVHVETMKWARQVENYAAPEMAAMVEAGRVSISAAAKVSRLDQQKQRALVDAGASAIVAEARRIVGRRGRQGRNEYAYLWGCVDEICNALEANRLSDADLAAADLRREISRIVQERRK